MKRNIWKSPIFAVALVFLFACKGTPESVDQTLPASLATPAPITDGTTTIPESPTQTEAIETLTPTPTKTLVPKTPTATSIPQPPFTINFSNLTIKVSGSLWVYDGDYWEIDFDEQQVRWMVPSHPEDCPWIPLANSLKLLCRPVSEIFLYDLISQQKQELPLQEAIPYVWHVPQWPDQLIYSILGSSGITKTIYSYNFITQETQQWGSLPDLDLETPLFPSADGQHWMAKSGTILVEIDLITGEVRPITSKSKWVTYNYEWSPQASKLIYGAADEITDVSYYAKYVYLLDMETNQTTLINGLPDGIFAEDEWPVWSPDGERVVIIARPAEIPALCVLTVETLDVNCLYREEPEDKMNYFLGGIAWSPSGDVLAFIENRGGDTSNLILYSPESGSINVLIEDGHSGWLFWR